MQTIPYSQQTSLQKSLASCLESLKPQTNPQHLQHYLRQSFYACMPDNLRYGVACDAFQVAGEVNVPKRFGRGAGAVWLVYVENSVLAHQFRFLAPELEKRISRRIYADQKGQSALPTAVREQLKQVMRFQFQVEVKADYFTRHRLDHIPPLQPHLLKPKPMSPSEAEAYLQDFLAKRFE